MRRTTAPSPAPQIDLEPRRKRTLTKLLSLPEDDSSPIKGELEFGKLGEMTHSQVVLPKKVFRPKLFPEIDLQALFWDLEGELPSPSPSLGQSTFAEPSERREERVTQEASRAKAPTEVMAPL